MGRDIVEVLEARPRGAWLVAGNNFEGAVPEAHLVELSADEFAALDEGQGDDEAAMRETARIDPEGVASAGETGDAEPLEGQGDDELEGLLDEGDPPELPELRAEVVEEFLLALREARGACSEMLADISARLTAHIAGLDALERTVLEEIDPATLPSAPRLPAPGPLAAMRRTAPAPATNGGPRMRRARTGAAAPVGVATTGPAGAATTRPASRPAVATASPPAPRRDRPPPITNGQRGLTNGQPARKAARATAAAPVPRHDDPTDDRVASAAPPQRRR